MRMPLLFTVYTHTRFGALMLLSLKLMFGQYVVSLMTLKAILGFWFVAQRHTPLHIASSHLKGECSCPTKIRSANQQLCDPLPLS